MLFFGTIIVFCADVHFSPPWPQCFVWLGMYSFLARSVSRLSKRKRHLNAHHFQPPNSFISVSSYHIDIALSRMNKYNSFKCNANMQSLIDILAPRTHHHTTLGSSFSHIVHGCTNLYPLTTLIEIVLFCILECIAYRVAKTCQPCQPVGAIFSGRC